MGYKRQCRIGIFGVGLVALCLVAAKAGVSNNNSRITNAKRSRRSTDNLDETGGNSTANNVTDTTVTEIETEKVGTAKWYTEPPFNYDESELISCKVDDIYDGKKFKCYATVNNYTDLADLEEQCKRIIEEETGTDEKAMHLWTGSKGADIAICIFGTLWLFVAVAIICDDFFVPSLEAISEVLDLSEDVAGATFMAAGSSAPELFTSLAATTGESDVGVGTIVGSAVFNLLVIVALSAALSGKILNLDWRPLARDATFLHNFNCNFDHFCMGWNDHMVRSYHTCCCLLNLCWYYVF